MTNIDLREQYIKETGDLLLNVSKYADWMEKKLTSDNSNYETAFQEAIDIQKEHYGNGMETHLSMIDWAEKWKNLSKERYTIKKKVEL